MCFCITVAATDNLANRSSHNILSSLSVRLIFYCNARTILLIDGCTSTPETESDYTDSIENGIGEVDL